MQKTKKSVEVTRKDLDEIIIAFNAAHLYMKEASKKTNIASLKKHYINAARKYERRMNKWIIKRNDLFGGISAKEIMDKYLIVKSELTNN